MTIYLMSLFRDRRSGIGEQSSVVRKRGQSDRPAGVQCGAWPPSSGPGLCMVNESDALGNRWRLRYETNQCAYVRGLQIQGHPYGGTPTDHEEFIFKFFGLCELSVEHALLDALHGDPAHYSGDQPSDAGKRPGRLSSGLCNGTIGLPRELQRHAGPAGGVLTNVSTCVYPVFKSLFTRVPPA